VPVIAVPVIAVPAHAAPPLPHRVPTAVVVAEVAQPAAAPVRVRVPSVGIDAALAGIGLDGARTLVPPGDLATAGWFSQGPAPGEPGPAVLAGHVDSSEGPAVFFRLRDVAPGDPVLITRADGSTVRFTVTRAARYAKTAFPTAEVYGPTPDAELRLITCGGDFDRGARRYRDNVVVFAARQGRSAG
jgi:sortase (surface protein transpeptidase)